MRFLKLEECQAWLGATGFELDGRGRLSEPYTSPRDVYALADPRLSHPDIVRRATDWLAAGRERLIFISERITYPPDQPIIFEAIRRGGGAVTDLAHSPGHLFTSTKTDATDFEDRPEIDVREESLAMWIGGLALEWTWLGFIAVQGAPT